LIRPPKPQLLVQIGPGTGYGGFIAIAPNAFGPGVPGQTLYTHSLGSGNNPFGVVGGPGNQKVNHACDGKGIDYLSACGFWPLNGERAVPWVVPSGAPGDPEQT
jgi:hypothetical protein